MNIKEAIIDLEDQLVKGNEELLTLLNAMSPEDQKIYAPKVYEIINQTICPTH